MGLIQKIRYNLWGSSDESLPKAAQLQRDLDEAFAGLTHQVALLKMVVARVSRDGGRKGPNDRPRLAGR